MAASLMTDPPRKPLTEAERQQNNDNRVRAQHVMALYTTQETYLRERLEHEHGVRFEFDVDGHPYIDDHRIYGEWDFEKFTDGDWMRFRLMQATVESMLKRQTGLSDTQSAAEDE